jgi:lysozyme
MGIMIGLNRFARAVARVSFCLAVIWGAAGLAPAEARNLYPKKGDAEPHHGVADARRHPVQGIDVSRWQSDIDWELVARAGTRFAFIKATEGGDHLDPRFRENWEGARAAGIPRGAYHFVFWCRPIQDQIRWFIRNVPKEPDALPPILDVEWNHLSRCPRARPEVARMKMRTMLRAMEAHYGKKPIIYTDIPFHEDVIEGTTEFNDYPFWIRSTAARPEVRYQNRPWEFWQFTTTGRVPGIVGDVDRNAFFGTDKQFRDWIAGRYDIGTRRDIPQPAVASPARSTPTRSTTARTGPEPTATASTGRPTTPARTATPRPPGQPIDLRASTERTGSIGR